MFSFRFIRQGLRVALLSSLTLALSLTTGCFSSDNSGAGSPEDYDLGAESNIPLASKDGALQDITFGYDSSSLTDTAKMTLKTNAQWLSKNKVSSIVVEGHCDERGTSEYNLALGERRAKAAMEYVNTLGVASNKLSYISYGEEIPLDPAQNESAYAKNRRAHFSIKK